MIGHKRHTLLSRDSCLLLLQVMVIAVSLPRTAAGQGHSPTTLIVKFTEPLQLKPTLLPKIATGVASLDALSSQYGIITIEPVFSGSASPAKVLLRRTFALDTIFKLTLSDSTLLEEALQAYAADPHVLYTQPNYVYTVELQPSDPLLGSQWALARVEALPAWEIESGSRDVIIAIIDTGIDYAHEDLAGNIWINEGEDINGDGLADSTDFNGIDDDGNGFIDDVQGWDFTDAPYFVDGGDYLGPDNDPADEHGHGTSIAGIAAAVGDNGTGITGLAFGCRLMNLRAGTSRGLLEEDDVASSLAYAADNGAKIVNMSFGDVISSPLFRDAIGYAHAAGLLLVASAGNSASSEVHYPSGFAETISVGATDSTDYLSGFSNYGSSVDIVAPGSSIMTTLLDNTYGRVNGTSAAAPFVSALCALVWSLHPDYTVDNVRGIALSSADDLGATGWDRYYAAGRINALRALQTENYTIARILHPRLDQGFSGEKVTVVGTASGVYMESYRLSFGVGVDPDEWQQIVQVADRQVIEDTLGYWGISSLADTCYALRLSVDNMDGTTVNQSLRVFVDRTPPRLTSFSPTPMLEGDEYALLLEFSSDDVCQSSVFYRSSGSALPFLEIPLSYETRKHRILLTASQLPLHSELQVWLCNRSGLVTIDDNNGEYYQLTLEGTTISKVALVQMPYSLHSSYLLATPTDVDGDGNLELVVNNYAEGTLSSLSLYEYQDNTFEALFTSNEPAIPRDSGDSDGDGRLEILAGYGAQSMIFEQNTPLCPGFYISWRKGENFWASRFADVDGDGTQEIIARIGPQFQIWENTGDNQYAFLDSLPNPSRGTNITGVPHVELGDFDGDNNREILTGDYDGDVYINEWGAEGRMHWTWSDSLPLMDTIDFLSSGDYDGDGLREFVVGSHSDPQLDAEHEYDARHWLYRIYDAAGDDLYSVVSEWRFFGFSSPKEYDCGVSSGDIDNDGLDELLINVFPDFYIIDYDAIAQRYNAVWHYRPNRSNVAAVGDFNDNGLNEVLFNDGDEIIGFELLGESGAPPAPKHVTASPLNTSTVELAWESIPEAEGYWLYWGDAQNAVTKLHWTETAGATIDTLQEGKQYCFAVTAVDSARDPMESGLSRIVTATPNQRPFVSAAVALSAYTLKVSFNEAMNESVKSPLCYQISGSNSRPSSVVLDKSGGEVILTLPYPLTAELPGSVSVRDVFDVLRTPIDTLRNSAEFTFHTSPAAFYLANGELDKSRTRITLTFSHALDAESAEQLQHYRIEPTRTISKATLLPAAANVVNLEVDTLVPLGKEGARHILYVEQVKSTDGIVIQKGRGDRIAFDLTMQNLAEVFTYPNPFSSRSTADGITFANLTAHAFIRILSLDGRTLRVLEEVDGNGGMLWDTRNDRGELVGSGIYLFYIISDGETKMGKLAIVR